MLKVPAGRTRCPRGFKEKPQEPFNSSATAKTVLDWVRKLELLHQNPSLWPDIEDLTPLGTTLNPGPPGPT